jgi:conjugal transfer/entry exclusion protein
MLDKKLRQQYQDQYQQYQNLCQSAEMPKVVIDINQGVSITKVYILAAL